MSTTSICSRCGQLYQSDERHVCFTPPPTLPPEAAAAPTLACSRCGDLYLNVDSEPHVCRHAETAPAAPDEVAAEAAVVPVEPGLLASRDEVEREVQRRVVAAAALWPTLEQAVGCLGCRRIFRHLEVKSQLCPHCRSAATFDVAALVQCRVLSLKSSKAEIEAMAARLDAVLTQEKAE